MAPDRDGSSLRVKVLFDTNALMAPVQFRLDIFEELTNLIGAYEPLVLSDVLDELRGLSASRGKEGSAARSALVLAEKCAVVKSEKKEGSVDEKILYYASTHGCMVVTNDRGLRKALLGEGVPVISLSGKKRLDIYRD
jgi:rRNA-processing protein FCF1